MLIKLLLCNSNFLLALEYNLNSFIFTFRALHFRPLLLAPLKNSLLQLFRSSFDSISMWSSLLILVSYIFLELSFNYVVLPHPTLQTFSRQFQFHSSFWSHLKYYSLRKTFPGLCRKGELTLLYIPVASYLLLYSILHIYSYLIICLYFIQNWYVPEGRDSIVFIMVYQRPNKLS